MKSVEEEASTELRYCWSRPKAPCFAGAASAGGVAASRCQKRVLHIGHVIAHPVTIAMVLVKEALGAIGHDDAIASFYA